MIKLNKCSAFDDEGSEPPCTGRGQEVRGAVTCLTVCLKGSLGQYTPTPHCNFASCLPTLPSGSSHPPCSERAFSLPGIPSCSGARTGGWGPTADSQQNGLAGHGDGDGLPSLQAGWEGKLQSFLCLAGGGQPGHPYHLITYLLADSSLDCCTRS